MILNAKEILKQLYNCCDLIEERLFDGDEKPGRDLRKQLLKDTASFAARVSARKTITEAEASFLNALTGRKDTAEVWRPVCCERESGVPESCWYFVQADKAIMRRHAMSREAISVLWETRWSRKTCARKTLCGRRRSGFPLA